MTGWSISVANTKRSLKSTIIRSNRCISLIPLILTLTALTFTLRSTGKMIYRKKGPSKENRKEPIVGLGLLLDANQIPIGMKLFPGNQSEKPVIRNIIDDLKKRNSVSGRTIQIADKELNCAENIFHALKNGDGYIFSKSVKMLPETEKTWVLLPNNYRDVKKCCRGDFVSH